MAIVQPWHVLSVHGGTVSSNPLCSSGESATNQAIEVQAGRPGGSAVFKLFATQPCLRSLRFRKALPRAMGPWARGYARACIRSKSGELHQLHHAAGDSGPV